MIKQIVCSFVPSADPPHSRTPVRVLALFRSGGRESNQQKGKF